MNLIYTIFCAIIYFCCRYVDVQMAKGGIVWALFSSLQSYWPGVQVLFDDIEPAISTLKVFFVIFVIFTEYFMKAFHSVWRRYGFTPEGFNLISGEPQVRLLLAAKQKSNRTFIRQAKKDTHSVLS